MGDFNFAKAMENLNIKQRPFEHGNEDCRGYSHERWFAINPRERSPELVSFHEWTHILLGHTMLHKKLGKGLRLMAYKEKYHDINEAECHATAIFAGILTGIKFDLMYEIEHLGCYTQGRRIPDDVKARALETAMKIAKAGGMSQEDVEKVAA